MTNYITSATTKVLPPIKIKSSFFALFFAFIKALSTLSKDSPRSSCSLAIDLSLLGSRASFLKDNIVPIQESGQLNFIKKDKSFINYIDVLFVDGHTEAQMIPHIKYKDKTIIFAADLLPSTGHIPLAYVMGYDVQPLTTLDEKGNFLLAAANNNHIIFLQHDNYNECCTVKLGEKGVVLDQTFRLDNIL